MSVLANPQHEAFAQARFAGKTIVEAHYAAGFAGDKASASRLNRQHDVQERIAELFREAAADTAYEKTNAVRDLLAIIHSPPSNADEENPLCEVRMGKDGPYHRLPPKLQAMARLIKFMGWDNPVEIKVELKDNFRDLLARIRSPHKKSSSYSSSSFPRSATCPSRDGGNSTSAALNPDPSSIQHPASRIQPDAPSPAPSPLPPALDSTANNRNQPPTTATPSEPAPPTTAQPSLSNSSTTANSPLSPRYEKFALARVKGLGVLAAYHAAGYTGDTPNLAWRLNAMPEVKARIAELNGGVADALGYHKDDAVRDLIFILRATPAEVGPDHPFCEMRLTSWGQYHRFPSKMAALTLLARMLGWNGPTKLEVQHDPDAGFKKLRECISQRS